LDHETKIGAPKQSSSIAKIARRHPVSGGWRNSTLGLILPELLKRQRRGIFIVQNPMAT
jgi:hypothetical protein